jgi:hypothetical protein
LGRGNREFALLGTGWGAYYPNDVSTAKDIVSWNEGVFIFGISDDMFVVSATS